MRLLMRIALVGALSSGAAAQAQKPPELTRQQRSALQSIVAAVDGAIAQSSGTDDVEWPIHVLRASDGSHYVAFTIVNPPGLPTGKPVVTYVRLATRRDPRTGSTVERSAVAEWLAGQAAFPLPRREKALAFGDMPIFGAASAAAAGRDPGAATRGVAPQTLQLLEMERERARERREAAEKERRAALEGTAARTPRAVLPFEDFDVRAIAVADKSGTPVLRRSLTAGPGEYDLIVGWIDPSAKDASGVHIVRRPLTLPVASTNEFAISSVIVADDVRLRETPLGADQQTANPYSIGPTEIIPARDSVLTNDERLALIFQVINAHASADGKPDVAVNFRVVRTTSTAQEPVGVLAPQIYSPATLPSEFDVRKGHPLFAAVAVPLRSFKRGSYRMLITADDRLLGVSTTAEATFTVGATAAALLRDAPALAPPFRRDAVLSAPILEAMIAGLRPRLPSSALAGAIEAARAQRFIELVREDNVGEEEQAMRAALRGLALYALGDTAPAVALPLRQALPHLPAPGVVHVLLGALRALEGNDREAIASWSAAAAGGIPAGVVAPIIIDAHLRSGAIQSAVELAERSRESSPADAVLIRRTAAAYLAADRIADAIAALEPYLARSDDRDAQWLMLHALFSEFVRGPATGLGAAAAARFQALATTYNGAGGPHAALLKEWMEVVR